jgi:hypothetical protein
MGHFLPCDVTQGNTGSKTGGYKAKRATKRELIVAATMIPRVDGTLVFSDRTEFSVTTSIGIPDQNRPGDRLSLTFQERKPPWSHILSTMC